MPQQPQPPPILYRADEIAEETRIAGLRNFIRAFTFVAIGAFRLPPTKKRTPAFWGF